MTEQEFIENERNKRLSTIDKAENDLEKKVTYISAGGLALSISFIDKVVDLNSATYFYILISGWGLLAITLILNLFGIFWSRKLTVKGLAEYDKEITKKPEDRVPIEVLNAKTVKRNNNIMRLDLASLITLTMGIITIVLFCSLNLK